MKLFFTALFSFCVLITSAQKGKVNKAKASLDTPNYNTLDDYVKDHPQSSTATNSSSSGSSSGISGELFEAIFVGATYATVGVLIGGAERTEFNLYPYHDGSPGEYAGWEETDNDTTFITNHLYDFKLSDLRGQANYFTGSSVNGYKAKLDYRPVYLVGVDATYTSFYEDVIDERAQLTMFSIMADYYRVRTKYVTGWWGAGYTYVGSGVDTGGFAYQLGVDVFPVRPVSFRLLWKQSFINTNSVDEFQAEAKYYFKRVSPFVGWHHNMLGDVSINGMTIGLQYIIH
ncbi:hypothetical protein [Neptunitalea lumnitzerae]|uniref:Uncharacterized protein n=1 Tax=Neptunitalea lumnitzerae TaxID=2965509 RepID=A0ABQ5MMA6_9FLAO|nr:hypothetical protein [Neptunitalea sp. Y10]GLB50541.1 hypothetical protein Y10_29090 [Neptunitalea sp. Y10]